MVIIRNKNVNLNTILKKTIYFIQIYNYMPSVLYYGKHIDIYIWFFVMWHCLSISYQSNIEICYACVIVICFENE